MLEIERQRDDRRERRAGEPPAQPDGAAGGEVDYYSVVDNLINNAVSSDSEAFIQQIEQENGQ